MPTCNAGDTGDMHSISGLGSPPGEGNGNPLQYSCLKNPMDRGVWWATVQRVIKTVTQLNDKSPGESYGTFLSIAVWSEAQATTWAFVWSLKFVHLSGVGGSFVLLNPLPVQSHAISR